MGEGILGLWLVLKIWLTKLPLTPSYSQGCPYTCVLAMKSNFRKKQILVKVMLLNIGNQDKWNLSLPYSIFPARGAVFVFVLVTKSSLTLCDPMDCSMPSSSVHRISQANVLESVAISFSRGSCWPRDWTFVSYVSCIGRWVLHHWVTWEAPVMLCAQN